MTNDDEVIAALYDAVTRDDAFHRALELLAKRFTCASSVLFYMDQHCPEAEVIICFGPFGDQRVQKRYLTDYAADDPAPAAMGELQVGQAWTTEGRFSDADKQRSRFLQDFYHPLGLREALGGPVASGNGRTGVAAIHRGPDRAPFCDADVAAFERIMPHIGKVLKLRSAFFAIETRASSAEAALDLSPAGVLISDAIGLLRHANTAARRILDRGDGLVLDRNGRIRASLGAIDKELQAAFARTLKTAKPVILRIPRERRSAYLMRLTRQSLSLDDAEQPDMLVLHVCEPDRVNGDVSESLAAALDLTTAAARLTTALLNGEDVSDYARRIGISVNTVKFHLKSAFAATGCRRQSDLVRLAAAIVTDLALSDV